MSTELLIPVAAGAIGFVATGFNPAGAALGYSVGRGAAGLMGLNGKDGRKDNLRQAELRVSPGSPGQGIGIVEGAQRVEGHLMWVGKVTRHEVEVDAKGIGGGSGPGPTTLKVDVAYRLAIDAPPGGYVLLTAMIGSDAKLLYDATASSGPIVAGAFGAETVDALATLRFHPGTMDQGRDPAIEAHKGPGRTPAYRDTAYLVLEGLDIGQGPIPPLSAEIATLAAIAYPLTIAADPATTSRIQGTIYNEDRTRFYSSNNKKIQCWDNINRVKVSDVPVEEPWLPFLFGNSITGKPLDSKSRLYWGHNGFGFTSHLYQYDTATGALLAHTFMNKLGQSASGAIPDTSISNMALTRLGVFERIFVLGTTQGLALVDTEPSEEVQPEDGKPLLSVLNSWHLSNFSELDPDSGSYDNGFHPLAVDTTTGDIWMAIQTDPATEGYLIRFAALDGRPVERVKLSGHPNPHYMTYDPTTHALIIEERANDRLLRFDLDSREIDASLSVSLGTGTSSESAYKNGPTDGKIWLENKLFDLTTMTQVGSLTVASYPGAGSNHYGTLYDPLQHAVMKQRSDTNEWFWFDLDRKGRIKTNHKVALEREAGRVEFPATKLDATALEPKPLCGYRFMTVDQARAGVEQLQVHAGYDLVGVQTATGFKEVAVLRGAAPIETIPVAHLGARLLTQERRPPLRFVGLDHEALPFRVVVEYRNVLADYVRDTQPWQRSKEVVASREQIIADLEMIAMEPDEARRLAYILTYRPWDELPIEFETGRRYSHLNPTNVVLIDDSEASGNIYECRLTHRRDTLGPIEWRAVLTRPQLYSPPSTVTGVPLAGAPPKTIDPAWPAEVFVLDINNPDDRDTWTLYAAAGSMGGEPVSEQVIERSFDGGQTWEHQVSIPASAAVSWGRLESALPPPIAAGPDTDNTLDVRLTAAGTLTTVTQDALDGHPTLNGFIFPNGEEGQFLDAALQGDGAYHCTHLERGRRGTEHFRDHAAGDPVLFPTTQTLFAIDYDPADIGTTLLFRAYALKRGPAFAKTISFTLEGNARRPWHPVELIATLNGTTWEIRWARRARLLSDPDNLGFIVATDQPLNWLIEFLDPQDAVLGSREVVGDPDQAGRDPGSRLDRGDADRRSRIRTGLCPLSRGPEDDTRYWAFLHHLSVLKELLCLDCLLSVGSWWRRYPSS